MKPSPDNPRWLAVTVLMRVLIHNEKLDVALRAIHDSPQRAKAQEMAYGVLRHYALLDAVSCKLLERPLKKRDYDIHLLLLVGLYELKFMKTETFASVNEAVSTAKAINKPWARGLINACLRQFLRKPELSDIDEAGPVIRYSHPSWFVNSIREQYPENWSLLLEANNARPPMHIRVNAKKTNRDKYLTLLEDSNIDARPIDCCPQAIALDHPVPVNRLPQFDTGWLSVQDGAAQLAAGLLDPAPGQRILDACAAPGGKACHILETAPDIATLIMVEQSAKRAQRITENMTRLQLSGKLIIADAHLPESWWDRKSFQRILLDAPCSATGVIRRHPDIKQRRTPEHVKNTVRLQEVLLNALWPLLDRGGKLLYVTCSVLAEENEKQVLKFMAAHDDVEESVLALEWAQRRDVGYQILPGNQDLDGFYYACLQKS